MIVRYVLFLFRFTANVTAKVFLKLSYRLAISIYHYLQTIDQKPALALWGVHPKKCVWRTVYLGTISRIKGGLCRQLFPQAFLLFTDARRDLDRYPDVQIAAFNSPRW